MTVDTEEGWDWSGPFPTDNYSLDHIKRLDDFQRLCNKYDIKTTYFANYAVMSDPSSARALKAIATESGAEIGMHIHPWTTPPLTNRKLISSHETYLHNLDESLIRSKLEAVYESHLVAGLKPVSFRGGRYSTNLIIQKFLVERNFIADCSVVPYLRWNEDGAPDYRNKTNSPERLLDEQSGRHLWQIPVTLGFTRKSFDFWAKFYDKAEYSILRRLRLIGILERLSLVRRIWLNFETDSSCDWDDFLMLLERMGVPVVTLTVHSTALFAGLTPYTRTIDDERHIFQRIERVFQRIRAMKNFESMTVSDAATYLELTYCNEQVSTPAHNWNGQ